MKKELTTGKYSGAADAYRQFMQGDVRQEVATVLSAADAPLMIDNTRDDLFFTIFHQRHSGVPVRSRIGCCGGAEPGDSDAIMRGLEVTIEETCLDFKNSYK